MISLEWNGGRAEEYGWTVSTNDSGLVIGVAQFTGNPIPGGEGILTQIPINISSLGSQQDKSILLIYRSLDVLVLRLP